MAELCVFYFFDQIRRGNALAVHLRNTSGGLMLLDDSLNLLQVGAQQVTGDGVLKCTDGITVFQRRDVPAVRIGHRRYKRHRFRYGLRLRYRCKALLHNKYRPWHCK